MSNEKTESYYKILGTTAKISNARIKEKYIQSVKQHPPETDPDGFEKVRRAYETLKDPVKRKQYDLVRKYGANVEDLLEKAFIKSEKEDYQGASDLLAKASKIAPENQSVLLSLMLLAIGSGNIDEMETYFEKALGTISEKEEIVILYSMKARALFENDYDDLALMALDRGKETYPNDLSLFALVYATIYMGMGCTEEAWKAINSAIPSQENETFEDIHTFISWVSIMGELDKWQSMSQVQSRFRKFLKAITNEEEKNMAYHLLLDHFQDYHEATYFRSAELYGNLLKVVADETEIELKEMIGDTKKLARIQKEIDRLERDEEIFPLIFLHVFEWFYEDFMPIEQLSMVLNGLPDHIINELKEDKEEYAAGIMRLRKKYPVLYKYHKENWDDLFAELTQGFNREMRRELRKVR